MRISKIWVRFQFYFSRSAFRNPTLFILIFFTFSSLSFFQGSYGTAKAQSDSLEGDLSQEEPLINSQDMGLDEDVEARIARIYSEHGEPVSDEKWSQLVGVRSSEVYSVETGDTLWDLSRTFFGDGFYWSKLWAENPDIFNPHQIEKGQAIRFISGTEEAAPEIRVVKDTPDHFFEESNKVFDKEDVVSAIQDEEKAVVSEQKVTLPQANRRMSDKKKASFGEAPVYIEDMVGKISQADLETGVIIEQNELIPRPKIPKLDQEIMPVLKEIPRSFAEKKSYEKDGEIKFSKKVTVAETQPAVVTPERVGFEKRPESMASIVESEDGDTYSGLGQTVIVEGHEPLSIGSKYYSVKEQYKLSGLGYVYDIGGVILLKEVIDQDKRLYRGQVIYTLGPVETGSELLLGVPDKVEISTKGRRGTARMEISGGGEVEQRNLLGENTVIFLESETKGEVEPGDLIAIQSKTGAWKESRYTNTTVPSAVAKVFHVSGRMVSAFLFYTVNPVRKGDITGPQFPTGLPDLVSEAPSEMRTHNE